MQTKKQTYIQTNKHTNKQKNNKTHKKKNKKNKKKNKKKKYTNKQTNKQTNKRDMQYTSLCGNVSTFKHHLLLISEGESNVHYKEFTIHISTVILHNIPPIISCSMLCSNHVM